MRILSAMRHMSSAPSSSIGFIGLGNMGAHMARNLLKAGHKVVVYDLNAAAIDSLKQSGAESEKSPAAIAERVSKIITMLPSSPHVHSVYAGADGIFNTLKKQNNKPSLLIDASTIDPAVSRDLAVKAAEIGSVFHDAPVSGGVGGAQAGTLTFMVGAADKAKFDAAAEILRLMGKNIVHCGDVGTGQVAKICNNMMLGISMIGVSETMNLGVKLGIDPKLLAGILNTSSGRCWSSDTYNPCPGVMEGVPASRGYTGGFGSALMLKDLGLALNAAANVKTAVPLGSLANQIYQIMCAQGYAGKDFSSAYDFLNKGEKQ